MRNDARLETRHQDQGVGEAASARTVGFCRAWDRMFASQSTSSLKQGFPADDPNTCHPGAPQDRRPALAYLSPTPSLRTHLLVKERSRTKPGGPRNRVGKVSGLPWKYQKYCRTLDESFHSGDSIPISVKLDDSNTHLTITVAVKIK